VKQDVVHLGEHRTADEALTAWEREIEELARTRPKQAQKLKEKLERLRELTYTD
jgi:prefoldin subunit 5